MAKIDLPKNEIRISIPTFTQDNTSLVREAYCSSLVYDTDAKQVKVNWVVQHFSQLEGGLKGEYLGLIVPDYIRTITASNDTMCNIETGIPIDDADLETFEGDYTGQYDFFNNIGENQSIVIHTFIRNFGLITDWTKK